MSYWHGAIVHTLLVRIGTYHRAWSPTIAELHVLVEPSPGELQLLHYMKLWFFNYPCTTRDTYPVFPYQLTPRSGDVFS